METESLNVEYYYIDNAPLECWYVDIESLNIQDKYNIKGADAKICLKNENLKT